MLPYGWLFLSSSVLSQLVWSSVGVLILVDFPILVHCLIICWCSHTCWFPLSLSIFNAIPTCWSSLSLSMNDVWFPVAEWTKVKKLRYLGVPQFHGSGQHKKGDKQYRFLVLQRLSSDLQKVFVQNGRSFSEKTTFSIGLRMVRRAFDSLEN